MTPEGQLQRDSVTYFISKLVPGCMGLLSVATFVRLFGYEQYGRYAVSLSIVMTLSAWAAGWLSPGVLRFSSSYRTLERARLFSSTVNVCTAVSMSLAAIVVGGGLWLLVDKSLKVDLIAALLAATIVGYTVTLATLQARLRSATVVKMEAARTVLTFVTPVMIVWLMNAMHYSVLLVGALGGYLLPILVYVVYGRRASSPATSVRDSATEALRESREPGLALLWAFGWPVALWTLTNQGLTVSDRYLVQHFQGYAQAGVYASLYDIVVRSFSLIFFPITLATHPIIMKHWNSGERSTALAVIRTSIKYQTWLCLPVLAGLALFGPWLVTTLLGQSASQATRLVMPLALGGCLWQMSLLIHKPLEIMCRTRQMLQAMALAFVSSVLGNYFLLPRFGMVAAAYVNLAAAMVYLGMLVLLMPLDDLRHQVSREGCGPPNEAVPNVCAAI